MAVLISASAARAQTQTPMPLQNEPVVVATGEGIVKAAPDQAFVTLAAETRSKNPKEAQAQNAKTMSALHDKLLAAGIPKDAIRTTAYDLQLESDWVNGRQVPRGYLARNMVEVRVDDITRVGEVIDIAVAVGVNSVHNVRFDLKNRAAREREALRLATADARARAEAAAAGAGATVGRVIRIEEPQTRVVPPPMPMMLREAMASDARAQTPVIAGEIEIRSSVVVTATLK